MTTHRILTGGQWRESRSSATFQAENPQTRQPLPDTYPVSTWADCEEALDAAAGAAEQLRRLPAERVAFFLQRYAERIQDRQDELVEAARSETALPVSPRLKDVELPRTTDQIRQAASAAQDGSWRRAVIDTKSGIRSCLEPIGPVCVFGPNNFPFAFGSVSGGDFAAAIAAGNPVIAKAHTSHPGTTRVFAEEAHAAGMDTGMPEGTVQMLYRLDHADGLKLVSDHRVGATGYTGSRRAGLELKAAADAAGRPIYLELSSINPVIILPGAIEQRCEAIADELTGSCLLGSGQFCTNPGLVMLLDAPVSETLISAVTQRFRQAPIGTLLSKGVAENLRRGVALLEEAGAQRTTDEVAGRPTGYSYPNTVLRVSGDQFLKESKTLQSEVFGNAMLFVVARDLQQGCRIVENLEGNLTGCVYSDSTGRDDRSYELLAAGLRRRVGRLLNDKMPTGVAVSPAMNHGGPYPATGHPGFTSVGIPASLTRFSMLCCYDNVRPHRLPVWLQDENPDPGPWRQIDGRWTRANVGATDPTPAVAPDDT